MSTVPPIRREILLDADPAAAFEVFTVGVGRWWPLEAAVTVRPWQVMMQTRSPGW
jgi:hypothetical protein